MMHNFARYWTKIICRHAGLILMLSVIMTGFALQHARRINISTSIDALMPEGAKSVQTLNAALKKVGSFASIQIVVQSQSPETSLQVIQNIKQDIDTHDWVQSSQYFEDISVLQNHKLLLLSLEELLQIEKDVTQAFPTLVAKQISELFGVETIFTLRNENLSGSSTTVLDDSRIKDIDNAVTSPETSKQYFISDDGLTAVLIVWPKPGYGSLIESKRMVRDSETVAARVELKAQNPEIKAGVAGRIVSQVVQFDAIIRDLKLGLLSAIILIALLIMGAFRSLTVLAVIFIPLIMGIIWTMGLTSIVIGGLNLITAFLILILFGLGIDFGIHNFSRYVEERRNSVTVEDAISVVMSETGSASLIAALTTSFAFFALMFTEFRAFTEFGFIAGAGILLTFIAMYSVLPAILVMIEKLGWKAGQPASLAPRKRKDAEQHLTFAPLKYSRIVLISTTAFVLLAMFFAPKMKFETNTKELEAKVPAEYVAAKSAVKQVLKTGNSRPIIVANKQAELLAIDAYFKDKIKSDKTSPTVKSVSSILNFVPDQIQQEKRLEVIRRLKVLVDNLQGLDPKRHSSSSTYLSIDTLNASDLPETLRKTYLGAPEEPGYLIYVDNAVNLDDSKLAQDFYDDVASFKIDGKDYFSASEGFILIDMLSLMKADALRAVLLVTFTTALMIFLFIRNITGTLIVLMPPFIGILITIGIMGAFGPSLSIMNMVILPSLVGISVDNGIHIFHRFKAQGEAADIPAIMNTTGRAAILTTLTTLIGFGSMITASMGGLRSMAILAIIGFLSCLIMTWILLPVILGIYKNRSRKHLKGGVLV